VGHGYKKGWRNTTVPKGVMGSDGLPLIELKFSVSEGDCRKRKRTYVFVLSPSATNRNIFRHCRVFRTTFLEIAIRDQEIRQAVQKNISFILFT